MPLKYDLTKVLILDNLPMLVRGDWRRDLEEEFAPDYPGQWELVFKPLSEEILKAAREIIKYKTEHPDVKVIVLTGEYITADVVKEVRKNFKVPLIVARVESWPWDREGEKYLSAGANCTLSATRRDV